MAPKVIRQRVDIGNRAKWVSGNNQQEVLLAAARLFIENGMLELPKPAFVSSEEHRFFAYAETWLRLYKSRKAHTTLSSWRSLLKVHIYPYFGDMFIQDITIAQVQEFMNSKERYSKKTIDDLRMLMGMVFESAKEDGLITMNPARAKHLSNPSTRRMVRVALTRTQALDVIGNLHRLDKAQDRLYVALLLYTGMRRSEVLGLCGEDIDLTNGIIHVRRGVTFEGNHPIVDSTKTEAGIRDIPLHPDLLKVLPETLHAGVFLIGERQVPITTTIVRNTWKRIKKTINVYDKTPHYFRHTFVTFARRAGVEEKTLQTIGGYADIETMRNVYTHTQDEDIDAARMPISRMFV